MSPGLGYMSYIAWSYTSLPIFVVAGYHPFCSQSGRLCRSQCCCWGDFTRSKDKGLLCRVWTAALTPFSKLLFIRIYIWIYTYTKIQKSFGVSKARPWDFGPCWTTAPVHPTWTAVFPKNEVFREFFAFCTPSPLLVPEGGIDMSPFDQPRTVSTLKSSGGGGRRKQSRDNHVISYNIPTYTQKSCVHPQLQLLTYTHSGRNPWVHRSRHALASKNIYMKIRMQTNHYTHFHWVSDLVS